MLKIAGQLKLGMKIKYVIFSVIPLFIVLLVTEATLRIADFKYSDTPIEMRSILVGLADVPNYTIYVGNHSGSIPLKKDSKQLWVPVNSFEKQYSIKKKAGVLRIATLGCSCTAVCLGTPETYPGIMEKKLTRKMGPKIEVLNAGVGSYSSFQGLQRLKYAVLKYHPDIITIFFGWNDHWVTLVPDNRVRLRGDLEVAVINFLEKLRTYQWFHYWLARIRGLDLRPKKSDQEQVIEKMKDLVPRVSTAEYEKNLNAMIDLAQTQNTQVLLITAPSDFSNFKPFLNFPFPKEVLIEIHNQYNEIVRQIARERSVQLLDLAQIVSEVPQGSVLSGDGIHFHPDGCGFVAEKIVDRLIETKMVE
jgi:lysophospholipase L1-like esterase